MLLAVKQHFWPDFFLLHSCFPALTGILVVVGNIWSQTWHITLPLLFSFQHKGCTYMKCNFVSGVLWRWLDLAFMHFEASHFKNASIRSLKGHQTWDGRHHASHQAVKIPKKCGKSLEEDCNTQLSLQTSLSPSDITVLVLHEKRTLAALERKRPFLAEH